MLHPPLPTRLDLCSSFLLSCWCLASPPSPYQVGPLLFLALKLLVPCFTPLSRPGWTFALPSSQVAGALLHPPLPTRLDLTLTCIDLHVRACVYMCVCVCVCLSVCVGQKHTFICIASACRQYMQQTLGGSQVAGALLHPSLPTRLDL